MIQKAELIRLEKSEEGTFGVLKLDGQVYCVTLEPEDRDNAQNVSCIPEGTYRCERVASPRFGNTFEITGVPDRSHILLHPGNVEDDTHGCVLLGRQFGFLRHKRGVMNSGATFKTFLERASGQDTFDIHISDASGGA
ncbi:DUF5675 family protein [Pseudodesulfovibrio sp.]|uniref:DUF5675 family protein n=1 Tax=unclassified Pseudodesulfovibrio TaxID=2661612 RepID=UPI003B0030B6